MNSNLRHSSHLDPILITDRLHFDSTVIPFNFILFTYHDHQQSTLCHSLPFYCYHQAAYLQDQFRDPPNLYFHHSHFLCLPCPACFDPTIRYQAFLRHCQVSRQHHHFLRCHLFYHHPFFRHATHLQNRPTFQNHYLPPPLSTDFIILLAIAQDLIHNFSNLQLVPDVQFHCRRYFHLIRHPYPSHQDIGHQPIATNHLHHHLYCRVHKNLGI